MCIIKHVLSKLQIIRDSMKLILGALNRKIRGSSNSKYTTKYDLQSGADLIREKKKTKRNRSFRGPNILPSILLQL